jgi:hypothetical protein
MNAVRSASATLALALLPGAAVSAPSAMDEAPAEQQTIPVLQGTTIAGDPATDGVRGTIDSVDERNDTITIRVSAEGTEQFKVQDGLIFNAVRYGDRVEVTLQNIAGTKTVVALSKE